ncbi:MAG: hypothetical protein Aurels2KO_46410 [Aureliella sp.]
MRLHLPNSTLREATWHTARLAMAGAISALLASTSAAQSGLHSDKGVVSGEASSRRSTAGLTTQPFSIAPLNSPPRTITAQPVSNTNAGARPSPPSVELPVAGLVPSPPNSSNTLGLEQLQAIAAASHPDLLRLQSLVSAARGAANQAGRQANPSVGIDFQQLFSGGQAEQYGVAFEQRVIRGEKRRLDRAVAGHEIQNRLQELQTARLRVSTNVRLAYIGVLRAQRQIDVARQLLEFNRDAMALTKRLWAADEVPRTDVLGSELEFRTASLELKSAENRHVFAWKQLEEAVSRPLDSAPLDGDLTHGKPRGSYEDILAELRSRSPEVALALSQIEQAKCFLARQRAEPLPDISTRGLLNWRDNGIGGGVDAGLAVSVPYPLWDKNEGGISQAFHQLQAASRRLQQVELALAARLTPIYEQYLDASGRVATYREDILPIARQTLDLTRETYVLGEASFQSLLLAGRTHAENQIRYLDALESLRKSEAMLDGLAVQLP